MGRPPRRRRRRRSARSTRRAIPTQADPIPASVATFQRLDNDGAKTIVSRPVADESPIAIEFNGIGYAVLMASAVDLIDLGIGFTFAERLAASYADIEAIDCHQTPHGHILRINLIGERRDLVFERVRHRISESSCGLCGIENLEQALRPLPRVTPCAAIAPSIIFRALAGLRAAQPLNAETGAVHAAALVGADGMIRLAREDVGRHNAFDKLIGAMRRGALDWDDGFALLTSRCSYELVEKAALADCPTLVTISAPTELALARAAEAGIRLVVLARPDSILAADVCTLTDSAAQ